MQVYNKTIFARHAINKHKIKILLGNLSARVLLTTDGRRKHSNHPQSGLGAREHIKSFQKQEVIILVVTTGSEHT